MVNVNAEVMFELLVEIMVKVPDLEKKNKNMMGACTANNREWKFHL